ncbi:alpha/beta fold hydrolase, partial [Actinomadura sp.]|uniref:alpha/beta fold hydrolase n=1 Tax=Actinomadura sp. TaxID=1989 RepID=UPI0037C7D445
AQSGGGIMATTVTGDGYTLWYEVKGDGPAVVFPSRMRAEHGALAGALAEHGYRVVRYKPRQVVGLMEPEDEAGGPWEPTGWTRFPADVEIADLHAVADSAGAGDFVLAGYSGMAALAGFLAGAAERAVGLMVGGFPLLSGADYWLGYVEGARAALLQAGLQEKADEQHLGILMYREWATRDQAEVLAALKGPKIVWYGSIDGEPECRMYDYVGGSAIARRVRETAGDLRRAGFEVIEFEGLDHIAGLAEAPLVAPKLAAALAAAGW